MMKGGKEGGREGRKDGILWYFLHFRSDLEQEPDPEPDPLFHETDPMIRIRIKMKRIRNTGGGITKSISSLKNDIQ